MVYRAPMRFIQTNLRETDAAMNVDTYVQSLVDASANVVLFNVGGIRAFYPTQVPFHYKSPYMKGDLVDEVIRKFHKKGIRFVARFDFSKVHESVAAQNPDWLYVGTDGKTVNYNGEVHACINGRYQQEYAFKIMEEAITKYPFDGIFFNNPGFSTIDYSLIDHGICQCRNCAEKFKNASGLNLPVSPDLKNPVYREYRKWQTSVIEEYTARMKTLFSTLNPKLVWFNQEGDVDRLESGTSFTVNTDWNYHATENTKKVLDARSDQMAADTYNYLMGMDYRHVATSPNIGRILIAEQMLNGASPGTYVIGTLENQLDRVFLPELKEMYGFHKTYEKLFTNMESVAKVGLIMGSTAEYRGIMRMLTEEHIQYHLIPASALGAPGFPRNLKDYEALILANVTEMDESLVEMLDNYVRAGGKLLTTGFPGISAGKIRLKCLGVSNEFKVMPRMQSTYLNVSPNDKLELGQKEFEDFDVLLMNSEFLQCKAEDNAKSMLKLVPNTMHEPPEQCYIKEDNVTDSPGLIVTQFGQGKSVFIPWHIGSQYNWKGNNGQRALFLACLKNVLQVESQLETDCSPLIEITRMSNRNNAFEWVGMINHSGQLGDGFREPAPLFNSTIKFKLPKPVKLVYLVKSGENIEFKKDGDWVECAVPQLNHFEMILCLYK